MPVEVENHLEERLLDQGQAQASYDFFLGSFAWHTPRHDILCPTICKIIILRNTTMPQWNFLILRLLFF